MAKLHLNDLTALNARDEIARGALKAVELAEACLEKISERDGEVKAFAHLDPDYVMRQAKAADDFRGTGRPAGPLHGVPVALKDIIDTKDMPTENGTVLDKGRQPRADAAVVERLRESGAILLGKTVTTELASYHPSGETANPHDPKRTPGGSSSGSAAAVGASMASLAIGTQTNGSVIRPASFCGVVGYKPSRGMISRRGILTQSAQLDHVGTFSRSIEDAALLVDVLAGYDSGDAGSLMAARPNLLQTATAKVPVKPSFAFVRSPVWDKADDDVNYGFAELCEVLGDRVTEVELPEPFRHAHDWHAIINTADIARNYQRYYDKDASLLSERMRGMIEDGQTIAAVDYNRAVDNMAALNAGLEKIFERFDVIVTPPATGEAPIGLDATGDPAFCTLWTYCGVPALTLPLLTGSNGMPIGVQLVGRRFYDGRLLRTGRWLWDRLAELGQDAEKVVGDVA